jgi:cobalt/nickel transport system ATP-binding protein
MSAVISVRALRYVYPDGAVALDGVDFDLDDRETVIFLGANGSGKTTFVLCLAGLLNAASGSILVNGIELTKANAPDLRNHLGLVFQDADDQLFMPTVLDDVMFGPLNRGVAADEAERNGKAALAAVGIRSAYDRPPHHLSAGEKRRVAIAGVLAMDPRVLVLDEPTTYLDPPGQRDLLTVLRSLPQAKILVTHDLRFASAFNARAVFFERGKIVATGPLDDVARQFNWNVT